jgi:hypothetical protein
MNRNWMWIVSLIPCLAYGSKDHCDMPHVLLQIRPGAAWTLDGDSYKGLKWLDKTQKKPTNDEIKKAKQQCVIDDSARETLKTRARLDLKNPSISTDKKVQDLILLLDMDR